MVRVANCPKCNHEAVIFDEADTDDWARCPECRTYFQIKAASAREIHPFVRNEDEAVLAEEESEESVETVCSALETRQDDSRRTFPFASAQTIAEIESVMPGNQRNEVEDGGGGEKREAKSRPPEKQAPGLSDSSKYSTGTVSDFSMLGTWSDLPRDEAEAQAKAVQAGEEPTEPISMPSDQPEAMLDSTADAKQPDRDFQFKGTLANFEPVDLDEVRKVARLNEHDADDDGDPHVAHERDAAWDDPDEMMRLLADAENDEVAVEDEAAGEESFDRDRADAAESESDSMRPPKIAPRRVHPSWAHHRRQRSPFRSIALMAIAGLVGCALGYYALFWIAGPNADFLHLAQYLPREVLPADFNSRVVVSSHHDAPITENNAAEVQASYAEPVEQNARPIEQDAAFNSLNGSDPNASPTSDSNASDPPASDDSISEPLEFDPPTAAALRVDVPEFDLPVVEEAPSFNADELAVAISLSREAQPGLVNGDLDGSTEVRRAKGKSYAILCDLAQKATFVDRESRPEFVAALYKETHELYRAALAAAEIRDEVARIVPLWLKSPNRKHGGIFFAGTLQSQTEQGNVIECEVDLGGRMITVLVPHGQAASLPDAVVPVIVVGWLVDEPGKMVAGYTGDASQAIWAGHIIPLE